MTIYIYISSLSEKNENLFQHGKYLNVTNWTRILTEYRNLKKILNFSHNQYAPKFNGKINETRQILRQFCVSSQTVNFQKKSSK